MQGVKCLDYLTEHKAKAMVFLSMTFADKELWIQEHLAKLRSTMAFQ